MSAQEIAEDIKIKQPKQDIIDRQSWPEYVQLAPEDLYLDKVYQREKIKVRDVQRIVDEFDPNQLGVILVALRKRDGEEFFCVIDGGHRTLAACILKLETVPCLFIEDGGRVKEAKLFGEQRKRRNLTQFDFFRAEVVAEQQPYTEIKSYLDKIELAMNSSQGPRSISFIKTFVDRWKANTAACKKAIANMLVLKENSLSGQLHGGLFYLEDHGQRTKDIMQRIYLAGGYNAALAEYNSITANLGPNTKGREKFWAIALINIYNKNVRKHKITLSFI
jgi:hypothetical protein